MTDFKETLINKRAQLLDSYNQILGAIQVINDLIDELENPQKGSLTMDELRDQLGAKSVEVTENES